MTLLQINTTANTSSTGRIAEDIGRVALASGNTSYIAYGVRARGSDSELIRIGESWDQKMHALKTRMFDRHGFASKNATVRFVQKLDRIQPDIIHLHNLHGYYLHVGSLFNYLVRQKSPVIWTFHDCWPFTGHCTFFEHYSCERWKTLCYDCPNIKGYPTSWWVDQSSRNYLEKKELFNAVRNLTIVTPSHWLANLVGQSFLQDHPIQVIHNGVDLERFYPDPDVGQLRLKMGIGNKKVILGVASIWDKRKGLADFVQLSERISEESMIVLVGLDVKQLAALPQNSRIKGIARTENMEELRKLYSLADVFVNPTYLDNFPNTNIEALACGTPVVTYRTGGSIEAVAVECGYVIEQGNLGELLEKIGIICQNGQEHYRGICRRRAIDHYDKNDRYKDYLHLYESLLAKA